jgi:hypothetical protein
MSACDVDCIHKIIAWISDLAVLFHLHVCVYVNLLPTIAQDLIYMIAFNKLKIL